MITYRTGNVFDAPKPRVIVHACNGQGVWGAGVAQQMKAHYPNAYAGYIRALSHRRFAGRHVRGLGVWSEEDDGTIVVSLITSLGYGRMTDPPDKIVEATHAGLETLLRVPALAGSRCHAIHSPQINAGRFRVSWDRTSDVIEHFLAKHAKFVWTVWTPPAISEVA